MRSSVSRRRVSCISNSWSRACPVSNSRFSSSSLCCSCSLKVRSFPLCICRKQNFTAASLLKCHEDGNLSLPLLQRAEGFADDGAGRLRRVEDFLRVPLRRAGRQHVADV